MDDGVVIVDGNGGDVFRSGGGESGDVREELVCPDFHSIVEKRVVLPIAQDSSTEGRSPFYLLRFPEVSSPCASGRRVGSVSGGGSELARGVEEFYLFVGTDDRDSCCVKVQGLERCDVHGLLCGFFD